MTTIMVTLRKSTNFTPYSVFLSAAIKSSFLYKQILVLSKEFQLVLVKITKFSKSFPHIKHNKKPEVNLIWVENINLPPQKETQKHVMLNFKI